MDIFFANFGRTELTIGESRAKNCEEVDFEVRFSLEAPKLSNKGEKRFLRPKNLADFFFFSAENWIDGDRLKRVLAKFRADPSHVRGPTGSTRRRQPPLRPTTPLRSVNGQWQAAHLKSLAVLMRALNRQTDGKFPDGWTDGRTPDQTIITIVYW